MRILLAEDEPTIGAEIASALRRENYVVDHVKDGVEAWFQAETEGFDGLILDLGLPRLDGLSVLRRLRAAGSSLPVIVLTARGSWMERVEGIDAGADDYLPKPFQMEELIARLAAILRRARGYATTNIAVGDMVLDLRRQVAVTQGRQVELTATEFRLLRYLAHNAGRVISQGELAEHVYESDREPDSNALEVLVSRVRRKIGPDRITTRRGQGYLMDG